MILRVVAAVLFAVTSLNGSLVNAATKELARAIVDALPWNEDAPDMEQRKRFALAIEAYWVEFDKRVPRLSPKEQEWVEGELAAQGERLGRAFASVEFAIWSLNQHSDQCLSIIRNVIQSYEAETSHPVEMFYWVKMVNCYDGSGDMAYYLDKASIPYNDEAGKGIQFQLSNLVQETIVNKAAPMAMAETMDWTFGP